MSPKPSARASSSAPPGRGFDKELAELETLAESLRANPAADAATIERIRRALAHRNNFIVSKAAKLVADTELFVLLPGALAAFDRFFLDAEKTDPQCWAKNALAKTLVKLEHRQKDAYLRGLRHHQMETAWGGATDTAGALRATCAHALVDCPGISDADLLELLLEPLTDSDKSVRIEGARAIGRVGGASAALILRLRALLGKDEPDVLGAVYSALLGIEGARAIPLVAGYLKDGDDIAAEAAFALSETRSPDALAALIARFEQPHPLHPRSSERDRGIAQDDTWFGSVLLSAIALTRLPEASDFLVALIARDAREAPDAIEAIGRTAPNAELRARVEQAVEQSGGPRLRQTLLRHFPAPRE